MGGDVMGSVTRGVETMIRRMVEIGKTRRWLTRLATLGVVLTTVSLALVVAATAGTQQRKAPQAKVRIAVVLHLRVPSLLQFCYGAEQAGKEFGFSVDCV